MLKIHINIYTNKKKLVEHIFSVKYYLNENINTI